MITFILKQFYVSICYVCHFPQKQTKQNKNYFTPPSVFIQNTDGTYTSVGVERFFKSLNTFFTLFQKVISSLFYKHVPFMGITWFHLLFDHRSFVIPLTISSSILSPVQNLHHFYFSSTIWLVEQCDGSREGRYFGKNLVRSTSVRVENARNEHEGELWVKCNRI